MTGAHSIGGEIKCRIDALVIGQRVDLQNDIIADPLGHLASQGEPYESDHPEFEYEFCVVESITDETTNGEPCLVVNFLISGGEFTCGFPPDHEVDVDGEQALDVINYYDCPNCGRTWHGVAPEGEECDCEGCGETVTPHDTAPL